MLLRHLCQSKQFIKRSSVAYCYWCHQLRKREMRASHNANQIKPPVHHSHHCRHFSFIIQLNFSKFKEGLHCCCDLNLIGLNGGHYQQHIANLWWLLVPSHLLEHQPSLSASLSFSQYWATSLLLAVASHSSPINLDLRESTVAQFIFIDCRRRHRGRQSCQPYLSSLLPSCHLRLKLDTVLPDRSHCDRQLSWWLSNEQQCSLLFNEANLYWPALHQWGQHPSNFHNMALLAIHLSHSK
jgi:hypothetical protein